MLAVKDKKPEIRFKGFSEEWEVSELGNIATMKARIGWQGLTQKEFLDSGDYYLITGTDFKNGTIDITDCHYIDEDRYNQDSNIQVRDGDVLITKDGTIGKVAYIGHLDKPATLNAGVFVIRGKNKSISNLYLYHYLAAPFLLDYADKQATGGTIKHLNQNVLVGFPVPLPQIKEQSKIGTYFKYLDHLITLHQRKYNKLVTVKKSMLEKMFPKNGATIPEIRFKGFGGKWEERKLGEILGIGSASRVHKNEWTDSGVPFFRSSDVVADYKGAENNKAFISFELYEELSNKSGCVQKNDLLVTGGGSIGIAYLVKTNEPLYFKDADLLWLKNSENIDGYFLYTFFSTSVFRGYVNSIAHIGTISHYTIEQAKSTPLKFPEKEEQDKIGGYFTNLDHLIILQQRELEKLKNIKKAMLEKMFV